MGEQDLSNKYTYLFVGGIPRSGTSMLQKMLSLNPAVYAGPEFGATPKLFYLYEHMSARVKAGKQSMVFNEDILIDTVTRFYDSIFRQHLNESTKVISEKTPKNTLIFDKMIRDWNGYKYLLIIRDPRSILASLRNVQNRAKKESRDIRYGQSLYTDLLFLNRFWKVIDRCIKMDSKQLKIVYYEDLVSDGENQLKEICDFIGLDFLPEMLSTENQTFTSEVLKANTNKSWYNENIFNQKLSSKNVEKWKSDLSKSDLKLIGQFLSKNPYQFLDRYEIEYTDNSNKLLLMKKRFAYKFRSYSRALISRLKKAI